ncbi:SRPBCC family protein [Mangrovihabitans endophyticus]|uniref:Activator of Hsp90 ATPase homologue 1/2-like C-terminal domain-containing protein n=1 Tax=Mangrovihabitans endophyticus TaxID=1751298 RepID=A0A8J3BTT4_9ACTN|nr:SRPBCC domain-containing protein [Mangrovihabitans endophyticus]GGK76531.1 hypothetical protein GCM10012284_08120 [Mangrovihabitans endophyticus]
MSEDEAVWSASDGSGAVRVGVRCACGRDRAWQALHDPAGLSRWFGDLTPGWSPGCRGRIEIGDGDFFDLSVEELAEADHLAFRWRFLGLGAQSHVRWLITDRPDGSEVTVEDRQPGRTPAETDAMIAGWTDFLGRLARHLRTGETSRYGIRDEIDGTVDLPDAVADPLDPGVVHRWLPIATDGFVPRWFFIVDSDGPRRFRLDDWTDAADEVTFRLAIPQAARPTSCAIRVTRAGAGRRLSFVHAGWCRLDLPEHRARQLRRRFTATWVSAVAHARDLALTR